MVILLFSLGLHGVKYGNYFVATIGTPYISARERTIYTVYVGGRFLNHFEGFHRPDQTRYKKKETKRVTAIGLLSDFIPALATTMLALLRVSFVSSIPSPS